MKINNSTINYLGFKQSFSKKTKEFNPYYDGSKVAHGVNYQILDSLELTREQTISELKHAQANGEDISQDREKLIYSRINMALKDAKEFIESHPEFDYDDVSQELIAIVVKKTDAELRSDADCYIFTQGYSYAKNQYFNKLLTNQSDKEDAQEIFALTYVINPYEYLKKQETVIALNKIIEKSLNEQEKRVIDLKFGFIDGRCYTFSEIGKDLNVSLRSAAHTYDSALEKLQRFQNCERVKLEDFYI